MSQLSEKENALIDLRGINMSYEGEKILDNLNLYIKDKEFLTLLGPSGCGKTTTLRIIGGFITPDSGDVLFEGKRINELPPHKRNINTVFQRYALFPHLNVYENVAFGLEVKKVPKDEIKKRVKRMLEIVDLKGFEHRRVTKLSGGQQQRVAIARALVNQPRVLLLDEPLGALDLKLRKEMQLELKKIQQQMEITFIYVTHDQEEAMTMSDTIVIMKDGIIQQIGSPEAIYNEPKNAFVADFIGEANIFDAMMVKDKVLSLCGKELECLDAGFGQNKPVDVVIRPEDIDLCPASEQRSQLYGVVKNVIFKGVHYEMSIQCEGLEWLVHSTRGWKIGDEVGLNLVPDAFHIMKRLYADNTNRVEAEVENGCVTVFGQTIEEVGLPDGKCMVTIPPSAIEVVSLDMADLKVYLESLIYKGVYNELIVYDYETKRSLLVHSMNDEQVATDIGIRFIKDKITVTAVEGEK